MSESTLKTKASSWDKRPWVIAALTAALYPYLLNLFSSSVSSYNTASNSGEQFIMAGLATTAILIEISIPFLAIWALMNIRNSMTAKASNLRLFLYFIAGTSPFYIITLQLMRFFGVSGWHTGVWILTILIGSILLLRTKGTNSKYRKSTFNYKVFRKVHGISALLLIIGFIGLHLGNHVLALDSFALHEKFRLLFNSWYQSDYVEPILFTLLGVMALTGLPLASRYSGTDNDLIRNLQIGAGFYLLFFLIAHVNAVLSARSNATETDWIFATGENGLINGSGILIPYYILSVVMILIHATIGLRKVLLTNNVPIEHADRTFNTLMTAGIFFTLVISAAVLGIQF